MAGRFHLNSRSLIFEPTEIELPLLRFKYCDGLKLKVIPELPFKNFVSKFSNQASGTNITKNDSNIAKVFLKEKLKDKLVKMNPATQSKSKIELAQISVRKFIIIDRNPPSPYSVDRCDKDVLIEIEEKDRTELFLRFFDEIIKTDDDENLHKTFVAARVARAMKKYVADSKDKIIYYAPCKLVQLFEQFYGFVAIKATKVLEFVPVVNITKDVDIQIPIREIKFINDHRYMFKPVGLEIFVYNGNQSYLLVFNEKDARDTIKEILSSNAPKLLEMHLDVITKKWMNGYIQNYDYLIYLNRFSSRSFNDISQYPIFPWIINEFSDDGNLC